MERSAFRGRSSAVPKRGFAGSGAEGRRGSGGRAGVSADGPFVDSARLRAGLQEGREDRRFRATAFRGGGRARRAFFRTAHRSSPSCGPALGEAARRTPDGATGASSSNHLTLQTYSTAQGSAILLARFTLPKASHAAQRAGPRSPVAGNLDAASLLSAPVQQNNDLLGTLTRNRAQVALLAVRLGRVAENSGHHQLGWLLTGMPNPPFQLVQVLPQRAQEDPEGFLGHPRWVGANPAYFKDVDYLKGRAKLVGRQPPSDRPEGSSPEPKARPKEAPKAAANAAAAGSGTQ